MSFVKGPCLCGDPYCPNCGNPEAARYEEIEIGLLDEIQNEVENQEASIVKDTHTFRNGLIKIAASCIVALKAHEIDKLCKEEEDG